MPDDQSARSAQANGRGREAERPQDVPAPGWKDIAWRAWSDVGEKNLFLASGGVTYAVLLALFPGLAALVSVYGLIANPEQIQKQVGSLSGVLPAQTRQMVSSELHSLAASSSSALGIGLVISVLLALWSASRGMSGLMTAVNLAYGERETRSFFRFNAIALVLTLGTVVGGIVAVGLVGGLPAAVQAAGFGAFLNWLMLILEWPLLVVLMLAGLAVLYRYAPDRDEPQWHWVTPGAITATALWIVGSILFSLYVGNFGSYNKTYGSLGGAVVLMTWLYLTAFVVLLGAAINAQAERQTRKDTTAGKPLPMGERDAKAADTLGESHP
ncbi:MAG TPA: YihY/virulence factor BrkB family protein [Acetobacteraceae bacterium]|nr:YihY/virulence factor BrkB family protein [Acetobacteraceae bacterium]